MIQGGGPIQSDSWILRETIDEIDQVQDLRALEDRLAESDVNIDPTLKSRVYEILLGIQQGNINGEYDMPGMFVVLGYNPQNQIHLQRYSEPDKDQNIFGDNPHVIDSETEVDMQSTMNFDGAVLIDQNGYVTDSGIYVRNIDPIEVLEEMGIENNRDLSDRFGFSDKVHARHLAAICASYLMPGTTTFTLSEETGILRVFEAGKILYSQISGEGSQYVSSSLHQMQN